MTTERAGHADSPADNDAMLTKFIATRDTPCPVCGYNLRGLVGNRCPECGRHLVLTVGTTEPRLGAFIAGTVGLSSGGGFSALLLMYVVFQQLVARTGFTPSLVEIGLLLSGLVVGGGGLLLWVRMRRRIGRASATVRWSIAAAVWLIGLTFPVFFLLTVS